MIRRANSKPAEQKRATGSDDCSTMRGLGKLEERGKKLQIGKNLINETSQYFSINLQPFQSTNRREHFALESKRSDLPRSKASRKI